MRLLIKISLLVIIVWLAGGSFTLALDGSGTQEDPWRIKSLDDFNDFAADPNFWDDYTRLETDVNLAWRTHYTAIIAPDTDISKDNFQGTPFTGVFDGNDHKIIHMRVREADHCYLGLFGYLDNGEIKNLGLEDSGVWCYRDSGSLVGQSSGKITNCYSTGYVIGHAEIGGLVGTNIGSVSNCFSDANVRGDNIVGGLIGDNFGVVSECYSTGNVMGNWHVGGLVGGGWYYNITNCYSMSNVSGHLTVGGLCGANEDSIISNCYATGNISGDGCVGGLLGWNWYGSVSNCYSIGAVNGTGEGDYVGIGGLVGANVGSISNCYSTGDVTGNLEIGGLVGVNHFDVLDCYSTGDVNGLEKVGGVVGYNESMPPYHNATVSNCFWDTDTQNNGVTESIGLNEGDVNNVEGLPTAQMQTRSTFTDAYWDFINVWNIGKNQTYPYLRVYLLSDINKDGLVNFLDFAITANQWLQGDENE